MKFNKKKEEEEKTRIKCYEFSIKLSFVVFYGKKVCLSRMGNSFKLI